MQRFRQHDIESIGYLSWVRCFQYMCGIEVEAGSVGPYTRREGHRLIKHKMRACLAVVACMMFVMYFNKVVYAEEQLLGTSAAIQPTASTAVSVRPSNPFLRLGSPAIEAVERMLEGFRAVEREGSFLRIPDGATLKLGDKSAQVEALRVRLHQEVRARSGSDADRYFGADLGTDSDPGLGADASASLEADAGADSGPDPGPESGPDSGSVRPTDAWPDALKVRRGLHPHAETSPNPTHFAPALERAVRRFQYLYGIEVDGIVGPQTRAELNRPISERIRSLELFLAEQNAPEINNAKNAGAETSTRPEDLFHAKIQVNIPAFEVVLIRDGAVVFHSPVVVGRKSRPTPQFSAELTHVVLNPSWTVPPTILRRDVLPKLQADPGYLAEKGFILLDREGEQVDPVGVDFNRYTAATFPYIVRQPPCAENVLGKVKFIFPNPHSVFMHDTNHPELFAHDVRAFSSGCIRVARPIELALAVLTERELAASEDGAPPIERAELMRRIESGTTEWIALKQPLRVEIVYQTVVVDAEGAVRILPDIYGLLR